MKLIEIGFLFCQLHAPSPHFFRAGVVKYIIKPKATLSYFQYSQVSSNFKFSNVASAFSADAPWLHMLHLDPQKHPRTINPRTFQEPVLCCSLLLEQTTKDLNASRVLEKIWRVSFPKASMEPWLVLFCWISFWTLTLTWWGLLPFFKNLVNGFACLGNRTAEAFILFEGAYHFGCQPCDPTCVSQDSLV